MIRVKVDNGKYTIIQDMVGRLKILRYGEPWIGEDEAIKGSKAIIALACELEEARARIDKLRYQLNAARGHRPRSSGRTIVAATIDEASNIPTEGVGESDEEKETANGNNKSESVDRGSTQDQER